MPAVKGRAPFSPSGRDAFSAVLPVSESLYETGWPRGMWAGADPSRLPDGFAVDITNAIVERGGWLIARPGFSGELSTLMGGPIYALTYFQTPQGARYVYFASRDPAETSGPGRLWRVEVSDLDGTGATPTEVIKTLGPTRFSFADGGRPVQMAIHGKWLYGAPGAAGGPLFRTDGATIEDVTGLAAPPLPPGVSLSTVTRLSGFGTLLSSWVQPRKVNEVSPGAEHVVDADFETGATNWDSNDASQMSNILDSNGGNCAELDVTGDYVRTKTAITNTADAATGLGNTDGGYSRFVQVSFDAASEDAPDLVNEYELVDVRILAYTSGAALIDPQGTSAYTDSWRSPRVPEYPARRLSHLFDLRDLPSEARTFKIEFNQPFDSSGTRGIDINRVSIIQPGCKFGLENRDDGARLQVSQGSWPVADNGEVLAAGGQVRYTFTTTTDWKDLQRVFLRGTEAAGVDSLHLRLVFKTGGDWDIFSDPLTLADDGRGWWADVSNIAAQLGTLQGVGVEVLTDVFVDGATQDTSKPLFSIESIEDGGLLTVGVPYTYRVSRLKTSFPAGFVYPLNQGYESSGSPVSVPAIVTDSYGRIQLDLSPIASDTAGEVGVTHYMIWREGGSFTDGLWRSVAIVSKTADSNTPAPFVTWTASSKTLVDNMPDARIGPEYIYETGRDLPPSGAHAICAWQRRLVVGVGGRLYISWVQDANDDPLYFTYVPDFDDPNLPLKGAMIDITSLQDSEGITALATIGTALTCWFDSRLVMCTGTDPTNFAIQPFMGAPGLGVPRPTSVASDGNSLIAVTPQGIKRLLGSLALEPFAEQIEWEIVLYRPDQYDSASQPVGAGNVIPVAWKRYVLMLFEGGGAGTTSGFLMNTQTGAWSRIVSSAGTIGGATPFSCAAGSSEDEDPLMVGGYDGQIYTFGRDSLDRSSPDSSASAFSVAVTTRAFALSGQVNVSPTQARLDWQGYGAATVTLWGHSYIYGGPSVSKSFDAAAGGGDYARRQMVWRGVPRCFSGAGILVTLSVDATGGNTAIFGVGLDLVASRAGTTARRATRGGAE